MTQARRWSAVEATTNIITGYVISWAVWVWGIPLLFPTIIPGDHVQAALITLVFTATSWTRLFVWRRVFASRSPK